jgi:hypothetical protein
MASLWECAMLAAGALAVYLAGHMLFPDPPRDRSSDYYIVDPDDDDY